jgi:LysM repeat protein
MHTVVPGESLYSIAAADGLSVAALAAANGLPADAALRIGTNLNIPAQSAAPGSAVSTGGTTALDGDGDYDGDTGDTASGAPVTPTVSGYVVQPGDTLWSIAQRTGTTVAALAAANGVNPHGVLRAGAVLGAGAAAPATSSTPASSSGVGPPYPTPETLNASQIGQIGANNGATWTLADAIAWEESGFRNGIVARDGGVGIMQVMPSTWRWIQTSLNTGAPLNPYSAADNVRAGSLMLHWLLNQTGGNPALAAAGYNQGLPSVRRYGIYPQVQQYVNDVMALRARFGGG